MAAAADYRSYQLVRLCSRFFVFLFLPVLVSAVLLLFVCFLFLGALGLVASNMRFIILEASLALGKAFGLLVLLGFDIAVFTPATYQRHSL